MSSELMPHKAGDSWVIEIPDEMAQAMGHRLGKPFSVDRLEKIIECVFFECAQRKLIIGRQKNYERTLTFRQAFQHFKAAQTGHLHVKKDQIRGVASNRVQAREAILAIFENGEIGKRFETRADAASCQRLVSHDQHLVIHRFEDICPSAQKGIVKTA